MSEEESANLRMILGESHARIARLEIAFQALVTTMADAKTLPANFADAFAARSREHAAGVQNETFSKNLTAFSEQWAPMFAALTKHSSGS
jgi:hypothetical protein